MGQWSFGSDMDSSYSGVLPFVTPFNVISDLMTWFVWSQIFLGFCSVDILGFSDT